MIGKTQFGFVNGYQQGRKDTIEETQSLIYEFDDYCDAMACQDCWMNSGYESCIKQWIDRKFEQLKEKNNG